MPTSPTYIVNDQPTDKDALDFTPYVETLADIIQTGNTPLTIGVFGTWGSGKTSLIGKVKPIRLAKVVAIQTVYPDLYNLLLKEEPRYLRELEEYYLSESTQERKMEKGEAVVEKAAARVEPPPALVPFLSQRGIAAVRRILMLHKSETQDANFAGLPPEELKLYFTLTRRAEAPQAAPAVEAAQLVFEPQMVRIPLGKFLMGSTKEQAAQAVKDGADKNW